MIKLETNRLSLRDAFTTEQNCLDVNLRSSGRILHQGDKGSVNEKHFIDFFRHYLPDRYKITSGSVIDSKGDVSDSIDIIVFDRQYTPTLLDNEKHRYVPAEAVYAVFECKPCIDKEYLEYAAHKAETVRALKRTSVPIHFAGGVYPPKVPGHIVAGILALDVSWADGFGSTFEKNHGNCVGDQLLDCGFASSGACFDVFDGSSKYTYGPTTNAVAFFAFRLLSRLQSLATVPAIDWNRYASQLSGVEVNRV